MSRATAEGVGSLTAGRPLLSLIVVGYCEGKLLDRAITSALVQCDDRIEILIVKSHSDCVVSNSVCLEAEKRGSRVIWLSRNRGLSFARNQGVAKSQGVWVCFLDGDDELPAGALSRILEGATRHPEAGFLYGNYQIRHVESGEVTEYDAEQYSRADGRLDSARAVSRWMLSGHGPVRRDIFQKHRGFKQRFSLGYQDVDFYFRLLLSGVQGYFAGGPLYIWNRSSDGMNARRAGESQYHRASSWRAYEHVAGERQAYEKSISPFILSVDGLSVEKLFWLVLDLRPNNLRRCRTYAAFLRTVVKSLLSRLGRRLLRLPGGAS